MRSIRDILGSKATRPKEIDWANEPYNPSGSISRRQLYALLADMNGAADPAEVMRLHNLPVDAVTKELAALKEELGLSSEDLSPRDI
jgi:hypothetical protein